MWTPFNVRLTKFVMVGSYICAYLQLFYAKEANNHCLGGGG